MAAASWSMPAPVLTLDNSTLSGNSATNTRKNNYQSWGGGIDNYGTTTVTGCTLSGNYAFSAGSGIDNHATLTVSGSTLSGNSGGLAATLQNLSGGTLIVNNNSSVSGNDAIGIENFGTATVSGSTVSDNSLRRHLQRAQRHADSQRHSFVCHNSGRQGGGIDNFGGTATICNSTLSDNSATRFGPAAASGPTRP